MAELRRVCVFCGSSPGADPRYAALAEAFGATLAERGIGVVTGGASVGKYDYSHEVVTAAGAETHFEKVAVKPGKPTIFSTRGETLVFCLPGNPVAALMTGRVLVSAALGLVLLIREKA